jgi:hypothetical protein
MPNWSTAGADGKRRSQRVILSIPVTVSGEMGSNTFSEQTQTLVINAHGALISLAAKISQGQKLQLKSATNPQPQPCKVVYVGPSMEGRTQFGIEFTEPNAYFWQITFPPEDWNAAILDEPLQPGGKAATPARPKAAQPPAKVGR